MADRIVTEDVEAILTALRNHAPLMAVATTVEHLEAEPGTYPPFVLLIDVGLVPTETFQHQAVSEEGYYIIRAITVDTDTQAAATVAGIIHGHITDALQGVKITVGNGFKTLSLRRGTREPMRWENVSSEVKFLHSGFKWFGSFGKGS